ncbi:energy-coupling factor ABC transporter ATP-binding protein [Paradonghicola geojensis]|nr:energy-coupling factor ABC transporter ATP-binding protein [Marivivens geojensis]
MIQIQSLSCHYGDKAVLDTVTLELSEARVAIVGRNGSGKSTLAKAISGLIRPEQGRILINGVDVLKDRKAALSAVGILFQNPDHQIIFPTVEEEISFGLRQLGRSKPDAAEETSNLLANFGKSDWAKRPVSTLSQGQRHLVCLMSVLAMAPAVIILDEPFSGLDIPTTRALQKRLNQLDQTLIHITHDPSIIADYDRVIWIEAGKVIADGTPYTVLPDYLRVMEAEDADTHL